MLASFCERMAWPEMETLLRQMQVQVLQGVAPEAHALTQLPFVGVRKGGGALVK